MVVPGRGERCSAKSADGLVRLRLPFHGDCDVNFAHAITNGPEGLINRFVINLQKKTLQIGRKDPTYTQHIVPGSNLVSTKLCK